MSLFPINLQGVRGSERSPRRVQLEAKVSYCSFSYFSNISYFKTGWHTTKKHSIKSKDSANIYRIHFVLVVTISVPKLRRFEKKIRESNIFATDGTSEQSLIVFVSNKRGPKYTSQKKRGKKKITKNCSKKCSSNCKSDMLKAKVKVSIYSF